MDIISIVAIQSSPRCPPQTCTKTIAVTDYNLTCSVSLKGGLPDTDVLEWLFAGSTDSTLPDDIMPMPQTVTNHNINTRSYTSTLAFPPLQLYHAGVYTCRVRGNERLAANINIRVNGTYIMSTSSTTMP